jgi:hypothetical protein
VQEGKDPLPVLSGMISTHSQIVSGGETILDLQLAYALTCALLALFQSRLCGPEN